jgi:hypothetical protein
VHVLEIGGAEEHEATIILEASVGYFAAGYGLATEGLNGVNVELKVRVRVSSIMGGMRE